MASELIVQTLKGPTSGANANKIIVPSGHTLDASGGTLVPSAGQVVQVQARKFYAVGFSTTSVTLVNITDVYVDITPTNANNLLIVQTHLPMNTSGSTVYARFDIYDTNAGSKWSSNTYTSSSNYTGTQWEEVPILSTNLAGTTSPMRLQVRTLVGGAGGTLDFGWSGIDTRSITVMEIAQ